MKDIVLVLSDQHSGAMIQNDYIRTPFLSSLAKKGCNFKNAYTTCPLCVPARMSFLTGKMPADIEVFNNDDVLPGDVPTIAHALSIKGYETVLVGRMHFKGEEQNHGFMKRLVGDITTQYIGEKRDDLGAFQGTMQMKGCLNAVGSGDSPVRAFDDMVLETSIRELSKVREKPLFMVIGFYAPHFPYVCDERLYAHYKNKVQPIEVLEPREIYKEMIQKVSEEEKIAAMSAYCGLVEELDAKIEKIYESCNVNNTIFIYTSDHGDQCGARDLYGKQTLYEQSIKIPLIIKGISDIPKEIHQNVSLIDLTATILEVTEATLPDIKGESFLEDMRRNEEKKHVVRIQHMLHIEDDVHLIEGIIKYPYKLVHENGEIMLFDLENDQWEERNVLSTNRKIAEVLEAYLLSETSRIIKEKRFQRKLESQRIMKEYGKMGINGKGLRITIPKSATIKPQK